MEPRRSAGHDHWFYESQTRPDTLACAPLVPEAAHIDDRFLLGLQQEACTLASLFVSFEPALHAARTLSQLLFPDTLNASLTHTLTLYDRLSTALTVAQVAGVQRLCNHYSARLNPLPGPDSSRESNNRLTQITQYARQLAMQPALITGHSVAALDAVGLTEPDIVTLNHVVGFVSYQARVVAALQAMIALPVRWIPGVTPAPDAQPARFTPDHYGQAVIQAVEPRYASSAQHAAATRCLNHADVAPALGILLHDAAVLSTWVALMEQAPQGDDAILAQAVSARILGCHGNFTRRAGDWREALLEDVDLAAQTQPVIAVSAQLTRLPERFSAAHLQPLHNAGWENERLFGLLHAIALANWQDRLLMALTETP